jgi:hypothetical protein
MLANIRALTERIRRLDKDVRGVTSKQVFRTSTREAAKAIVDQYFREDREPMIIAGIEDLSAVDTGMQALLEIAQRNSAVVTYRACLKGLERSLLAVEMHAVTRGGRKPELELERVDQLIIDTLAAMLPSAARSYEQALTDIQSPERLSWRGPATDLRESLRETLDHLAPDDDVTSAPGFKPEKDTTGPTMKQKVRHVLRNRGMGKTATQSPEAATQAVDEIVGTFVRGVYTRSSVSAHTPTDRMEILRIRDWVRVALCELLEIRVGA